MTALSNEEFAAKVVDGCAAYEKGYGRPHVYYDVDGNCIEFVSNGDDFCGEPISNGLVAYISRKTGKVIGFLVEDVQGFLGSLEVMRKK